MPLTLTSARPFTSPAPTRSRPHRLAGVALALTLLVGGLSMTFASPARASSPPDGQGRAVAAPIARVVASSPGRAELNRVSPTERLRLLARCTQLRGNDYCLHIGFVDDAAAPALWRDLARQVRHPVRSRTGDLSLAEHLRQVAALPRHARMTRERRELERAASAPAEPVATRAPAAGVHAAARARAGRVAILRGSDARRQVKYYYCGPATLQMIDGADDRRFDTQQSWASDLGTDRNGATWIGDVVSQINAKTRWDSRAGSYAIRDIHGWSKRRYWRLITHQIDQGAPYVEHPRLSNRFHTYLSTAGSYGGHYQVGRGYRQTRDGTRYVLIFEPYNEPDWTGYTTPTWGERRVRLWRALDANQANQSTIGI